MVRCVFGEQIFLWFIKIHSVGMETRELIATKSDVRDCWQREKYTQLVVALFVWNTFVYLGVKNTGVPISHVGVTKLKGRCHLSFVYSIAYPSKKTSPDMHDAIGGDVIDQERFVVERQSLV